MPSATDSLRFNLRLMDSLREISRAGQHHTIGARRFKKTTRRDNRLKRGQSLSITNHPRLADLPSDINISFGKLGDADNHLWSAQLVRCFFYK